LQQLIRTLEVARVEEHRRDLRRLTGRPQRDRAALARAFVTKAVLNLPTTEALIDRLQQERSRKRLCGFDLCRKLPDAPTFSRACATAAQRDRQGFKQGWIGYQLHGEVADGGIPISAWLTSASGHDRQVSTPLARMSAQRVTHLYDLADAGYGSPRRRDSSRPLGQVPLIDHNPRRGEKIPFAPHAAFRYQERCTVERANARLKAAFGGRSTYVRTPVKVMAHLLFGMIALTGAQLMRWTI
jgi:hypothetical protein